MKLIVNFLAGLIFSAGLIVSGMINPEKVIGFLDLFGAWDPSLAFVMGGAVIVTAIGYKLVLDRPKPLLADSFSVPQRTDIDTALLAGPVLFGVGWGLVGLCPGPAFAAVVASPLATLPFFISMLAGMWLARNRPGFSARKAQTA